MHIIMSSQIDLMDTFSTIYYELSKPLTDLIEHCTYDNKPDLNFKNVPDNAWRTSSTMNGTLVLTFDAHQHYYKIVPILRKTFPIITEEQHQRNIQALLVRIFIDPKKNVEKITKDWLSELFQLKLKDHECVGLIAGYPFPHSLKIGNVTIMPINSKEAKELNKKYAGPGGELSILKNQKRGINAIFCCTTKAYDDDSCMLISKNNVNRVLNFIKLIDPYSEVRLQVKNYKSMGDSNHITTENGTSWIHDNVIRKDRIKREYFFENIEKLIKAAEKFFFKKDVTYLQKSILSALYWYGRVDVTFDNAIDQYISYINGLERLVLFDSKQDKAEVFGDRISKRFKHHDKQDMIKFYKKRNELLHEREPDIYEEDLTTLRFLLHNLITDLVYKNEEYNTLYLYFRNNSK